MIGILGSRIEKNVEKLIEELKEYNVQFMTPFNYKNFNPSVIYCTKNGREFDYKLNTKYVNSFQSVLISANKIETTKVLEKNNISQPEYLITDKYEEIEDFVKQGQIIIKFPSSCAGKMHYIINYDNGIISNGRKLINYGNKINVGKRNIYPSYLVQRFVSRTDNEFNDRVYRTYVVGNEVKFASMRIKEVKNIEDSIINIAQGARYEFIEVNKKMRDISLKTADAVGFDIGVVDILEDSKGKYYVIECDVDGKYFMIDRKFMEHPDFCDKYNFNKMIGKRLVEIANGSDYRK